MQKLLPILLLLVSIIWVLFGAMYYFWQRSFMYLPQANARGDLYQITVSRGPEHISVLRANPLQNDALIYFGGNAEDVSRSAELLTTLAPNKTVYLVNYRGYGASTGKPTQIALFADSVAVYDQLSAAHTSISVMGRSLGTGVATYLAAQRPVSKIVLVTPFDNMVHVAQPMLAIYPMRWMLKDQYPSSEYAQHVTAPSLLIAAENDKLTPPILATALEAAFPAGSATLHVLGPANHFNIVGHPQYNTIVRDFLAR